MSRFRFCHITIPDIIEILKYHVKSIYIYFLSGIVTSILMENVETIEKSGFLTKHHDSQEMSRSCFCHIKIPDIIFQVR